MFYLLEPGFLSNLKEIKATITIRALWGRGSAGQNLLSPLDASNLPNYRGHEV